MNKATISTDLRDGLENLIAQLGTENDKRFHSKFTNSKHLSLPGNHQELSDLYRTDWLAGKIVDIVPDDMTREWRSFTGTISPDIVKKLEEEEDRISLSATFNLAHKWARLYGTSFIILSVNDGKPPWEPLDIRAIKKGGLRHIKVIDRTRVNHADLTPIVNPMDPDFGMPQYYRMVETSIRIHYTRVIRFDGVLLPYEEFRRNNYFSDSVIDRLYDSLINFNTATNASASMIHETNSDVVKVKGLMNHLQSETGETLLRKRFALAKLLKSFNNMFLLDNEEDFETKTNTFSGLPDLIDRFAKILASATDIPATRLLGESASGLNATGEGDLKNYYDKIRSLQINEYKPKLDIFDKIMAMSLGLGENIELDYEFNSLFQMTEEQQAELESKRAVRDQAYYNMGVLTESIIAKELQQNETYTNIDDAYIKSLEDIEDEIGTDTIEGEDPNKQEPKEKPEDKGSGAQGV